MTVLGQTFGWAGVPTGAPLATGHKLLAIQDGVLRGPTVDELMAGVAALTAADLVSANQAAAQAAASAAIVDTSLAFIASKAAAELMSFPEEIERIIIGFDAPYLRVGSEPSHAGKLQTADGDWWEIQPVGGRVDPLWFGCAGDGTTNDYTNFLATDAYAVSKGCFVDGAGRTYKIRQSMDLGATTRNRWRNLTLDFTNLDTTISEAGATLCIRKSCTAPALVGALTANALRGASAVVVADASTLAQNDYVLVVSDYNMTSSNSVGVRASAAELKKVKGVSSGTVTFYSPLRVAYNTADNAKLYKVQTAAGVDWQDVNIIGGRRARTDRGLSISYGFNNRYDSVQAWFCHRAGVVELACFGTRVNGPWYFENDDINEQGYGLSMGGCHDCYYGTIIGRRLRHAFNSNTSGSAYLDICARDISLGDIFSMEALGSPFDTHAGVGLVQVGNVFAHFSDDADTSSALVFCQGAGVICNSAVGLNCIGRGPELESYGWREPDFDPIMQIGFLSVETKGALNGTATNGDFCTVENITNTSGSVTPQTCRMIIGGVRGIAGYGIRALPTHGDVVMDIGPGRIKVTYRWGVRAYSTAVGKSLIRLDRTEIDFANATFTAFTAEGDLYHTANGQPGARIEWRGGRYTGAGSADFSIDDGTLLLDGVEGAERITLVGTGVATTRSNRPFANVGRRSTATIASGVITVTTGRVEVDTEAAASTDNLDTINGGGDGDILVLYTANADRDVVLKNATGNLRTGSDITLSHPRDCVTLWYDGTAAVWRVMSFGDNSV
jgi:hypothetical protein